MSQKTDRVHVADIVIVGEVESLERDRLLVKTDYMDTVEVDWEQVKRVESKLYFEIEIKDGSRYFGNLVASFEDRVLAVQDTEIMARLPFSEIVTIYQAKTGFWGKIDFETSLGYSFVKATESSQGSVSAELTRRTGNFVSQLTLLSTLSKTENEESTRNDAAFLLEREVPGRWTFGFTAQFQTNESQGLDQRWIMRAGPLYRILHSDTRELTLGVGLASVRENYANDQAGGYGWEGVLGVRYRAFHFDNPELEVDAVYLAFPSLSVSGRWRTEFNAEMKREIGRDLFFSLSAYWSRDTEPVIEASDDDLSVTASLGWKP